VVVVAVWLPYGAVGPVRVDEIEVTLGMIEELFMLVADCKHPMLNPIAGMLLLISTHLDWLCTRGVLRPQANPLVREGEGTLAPQLL